MIKRSDKLILTLAVIFLFFPFFDQFFEYLFNLMNFRPEIYLSDYTGETVNQIIKNGTYAEGIKLEIVRIAGD